jgi:hypothetical protein
MKPPHHESIPNSRDKKKKIEGGEKLLSPPNPSQLKCGMERQAECRKSGKRPS